jgi:hypothetical protein
MGIRRRSGNGFVKGMWGIRRRSGDGLVKGIWGYGDTEEIWGWSLKIWEFC